MRTILIVCCALICAAAQQPPRADLIEAGRKQFEARCAPCHGADAAGGERGPSIVDSSRARKRSQEALAELIRKGIPAGGMPGFDLPDSQLQPLVAFVHSLTLPAAETPLPGDPSAGRSFFFGKGNCASCHMLDGHGGWIGPDLTNLGRERTLREIEESLRSPGLHIQQEYRVVRAHLRDGRVIRGLARNESNYDLQLQSLDGSLHLLRSDQIVRLEREEASLMPALQATDEEAGNLLAYLSRLGTDTTLSATEAPPSSTRLPGGLSFERLVQPKPGDWPTYHGRLSGNRHSPLGQIHTGNVAALAPRWIFPIPNSRRLEVTPLVADGVMYATGVN